jgi:hypothetical protein
LFELAVAVAVVVDVDVELELELEVVLVAPAPVEPLLPEFCELELDDPQPAIRSAAASAAQVERTATMTVRRG